MVSLKMCVCVYLCSVCAVPDKIEELLKAGVLTGMTRLVLVNAVYFKGSWMHRFREKNTKQMPFTISSVK